MRTTFPWIGGLLCACLSGSLVHAQPYYNPYYNPYCGFIYRRAPDCGNPGYYVVNQFGMVYGPNYYVVPPFQPFNGIMPPLPKPQKVPQPPPVPCAANPYGYAPGSPGMAAPTPSPGLGPRQDTYGPVPSQSPGMPGVGGMMMPPPAPNFQQAPMPPQGFGGPQLPMSSNTAGDNRIQTVQGTNNQANAGNPPPALPRPVQGNPAQVPPGKRIGLTPVPATPIFPTHPFARSPRDYFMLD